MCDIFTGEFDVEFNIIVDVSRIQKGHYRKWREFSKKKEVKFFFFLVALNH